MKRILSLLLGLLLLVHSAHATPGIGGQRTRTANGGANLIGDRMQLPTASFVVLLSQYSRAYHGPIVNLRRSSDNATRDFYPMWDGSFPANAALCWAGGSTLAGATWYDQGGSARNVTQASAGAQPALAVLSDGNAKLTFAAASSQYLAGSDTGLPTGSNARSIGVLETGLSQTTVEQDFISYATIGTTAEAYVQYLFQNSTNGQVSQWGANVQLTHNIADGNPHSFLSTQTGGTYHLYADAIANTSSGSMTTTTTLNGTLSVGRQITNGNYLGASLGGIGLWALVLSVGQLEAWMSVRAF